MNKSRPKLFNKCFWLHAAGIIFVGLGFIGMALPVMPTTIFFILALACFTRSSPKFANWLLTHPKFGEPLRLWQDHQVIPSKGKWGAGLGMLLGFIILAFSQPAIWVLMLVASIEMAVMAYIISKPSTPPIKVQ
ncbi:DUF454 domain-containing protein [Pseudoalteromonas phenolica]|uniref:Inner membrane protein n=1 Tax=Pseudoalteromonas phenolica TaxID=161398 RepID=A0A4Q7IL15_9GAMM|nr:YbaN family protein [Pseudoalteromonas phenolica]RZQ52570.1 DUF454 domain-containing protein [Pseudoalteromonas phenolica]TMN90868.1 DUF454 domain-containing protein [Pseudoalteromonas phenolica]